MTTRRSFLATLLAASASPSIGWAAVGSPAYLAAAQLPGGDHILCGIDHGANETFRAPLPARGHAGAGHPARAEAVVFARRPGYFALVIDARSGRVLHELVPPEGHQFNGHGIYIDGGATLVTVEQMAEGSQGRIGLWDVTSGYTRIDGFASHGIGPHDARLMPDGRTLVVANGGIETDAADRTKLNLATMRPNLAYLGPGGDLLEMVELDEDLRQNSIRHLAVRSDGLVGFAMQWEGEPDMGWPLLGLHRRGAPPVLAEAPLADELAMRGYAGSAAFSADESEIAITSPRGGRLHRFAADGRFISAEARDDVCGIAPHPEGFIASDGLGGLIAIGHEGTRPLARHDCAWDNHIVAL